VRVVGEPPVDHYLQTDAGGFLTVSERPGICERSVDDE
jgi:hypothetical protein